VATRHTEWFRAFVIGNAGAWPMRGERSTEWFSKALGSSVLGGLLVRRADVFVNVFMRGGIRCKKPTPAQRQMYKRPHPPLAGAGAGHAAGILAAHQLLAEVEQEGCRGPRDPLANCEWPERRRTAPP
jgi:haloalkane dehalogenase